MSQFDQPLNGFRFVKIHHGDTLQKIALREMGDTTQWSNLAYLNNLVPPFVTDDPVLASAQVLLSGSMIMLPSASTYTVTDPTAVYGADCLLSNGDLVADNGDFKVVSGLPNLEQAIGNVLQTAPGDLMFLPTYGCRARSMIGEKNTAVASLLSAQFIKDALLADPRIQAVPDVTVRVAGDALNVDATVNPIMGVTLPVSTSI